MSNTYKIPMNYQTGRYHCSKLPAESTDCLELSYYCDMISYEVPEYSKEARMYSVKADEIEASLTAEYNENGLLKKAEYICGEKTRLVYIRYADEAEARLRITEFAEKNADAISEKIISLNEKLARVFIEYFFDGEAVDFAARIGTPSDMQEVIDSYNGTMDAVDNGGDYPYENRIECDNETLGIMLMCAPADSDCQLFAYAAELMTERIRQKIDSAIDKSDDFKFIAEEYD